MATVHERSSLETTAEMLRFLNDEQLAAVQSVVRAFLSETENYYRPLTEDELTERIDEGMRDIEAGRYENADVVVEELGKEFGL